MLVEVRQATDRAHHVHRLVEDRDGGSAQGRALGLEVVEVHERVLARRLVHNRHRGSARDHGLQVGPPPAHSPAVLLEQLLHGDGHLLFHHNRVVHVATDAEELGAAVVFATKPRKPTCPTAEDCGGHRHGFNVGHRGRATKDAHVGWKGRLETRLPLLALEGFYQGCFLTADVSTGAAVKIHVEVVATAARVLPEVPSSVGLVDGFVEHDRLVEVLPANVNVGGPRAHRESREEAAFDQFVRVLAHDFTVLASAGL
mmetsp:Transcript_38024/g.75187  ORF Transcript_38024/g.75187 Transcript_38024/m.75187 type:complete len:257 (+) Transcript_38024:525-1295(+)